MKKIDKVIAIAAGVALVMALAACGKSEPAATASPAAGGDMYAVTAAPAATVQPSASAAATPTPAATPAPSATPGASASASPAATASAAPSASASATAQASAAPTATPAPSASAAAGPVSVEASNWKWTLSQTEFSAGQPIKFVATSKQGVHGFSIVGTNVNVTLQPGATQEVTWTPDKPGEYTIKCALFCGTGHSKMETTIIVK